MTTNATSQRFFPWRFLRWLGTCILVVYFLYLMANLADVFHTVRYFLALSHYDETTNMEPVSIELYSIDAQQKRHSAFMTLPKAYLDHKQDWKGGALSITHLKAEWHAMQPWTIASKAHPEYDYRDGVSVLVRNGYGTHKIQAESSVAAYINNTIDKGMTSGGYHHYVPKDATENEKIIRQSEYLDILLPSDNTDKNSRVIQCINAKHGPDVGCTVYIFSDQTNLLLQYTFARDQFEHWREIDRNVLQFIHSIVYTT